MPHNIALQTNLAGAKQTGSTMPEFIPRNGPRHRNAPSV